LLYGTYPYLEVEAVDGDSKRLTLSVGKFANLMRVRNAHIIEYLEWLDNMSFLTIVRRGKYSVTVLLEVPTLFSKEAVFLLEVPTLFSKEAV
jgi:hypothetical protein